MPQFLTFEDYDCTPEPHQIEQIYASGFKGIVEDQFEYFSLRSSLPSFFDVFPEAKLRNLGKGQLSFPFKAALTLDPDFGRYEAQTTGDCVSHATRNAGMMDYCVDALFGETSYEGRLATENIYGYRGHGGQGASCARLAKYVSLDGPGGFLPRKVYFDGPNAVDLSIYNSRIGHNWGSRGTPQWLNKIASENKALNVLNIKSIDEAIAAIYLGFGLSRCSGLGFSSKRNDDGLAEQKGSWSHAEAWIGYDDTDWAHQKYSGTLFLEQNSWGIWNSGPKRHEQPDGSYFMRPSISSRMISGGGVFAFISVRGFNRELIYDQITKIQELSKA